MHVRKGDCLGGAVLLCLVCLFDLACFFLPSHLSFKNMYMYAHTCIIIHIQCTYNLQCTCIHVHKCTCTCTSSQCTFILLSHVYFMCYCISHTIHVPQCVDKDDNCLSLTKVFRQFLDAVLRGVQVREGSEPGEAWRKPLHLVLSDVQYHQVGQTHHAL